MRKFRLFIPVIIAFALFLFQFPPSQAMASNNCLLLNTQQFLEADSKLIPVTENFTVEFDFYLAKNSQEYAEIISQGDRPQPFYFGIDPQLTIRAGDSWENTGAKMPVKKWVHIALTKSSEGQGVLYLDGKKISSINGYRLTKEGANTRIGAQYDSPAGERIHGCIDNLTIWKSVRSKSEVMRDSATQPSPDDPELINYFDFESVNASGLVKSVSGFSATLKPLIAPDFPLVSRPYLDYRVDFSNRGGLTLETNTVSDPPGYYVLADLQSPFSDKFRSGFGWYSTAWPISTSKIDNFQLGLSSTWIIPDNRTVPAEIAQKLCATATGESAEWFRNVTSTPNAGTYGLNLMQSIEGSLGWWAGQHFKTVFPKYMPNVTQNCYSTEVATPGWGFFKSEPTSRANTGIMQISNQILMPPDGMTFVEDNTGPQLGVTWHALRLPRFDHAFGSKAGNNSWTLFMNSTNFKGPIAFVAPQFWVDGSKSNPAQRNLTLDKRPGRTGGLASEWGAIPLYTYTELGGKVVTKIPQLQFPIDSSGNFVMSRDFTGYSSKSISPKLGKEFLGSAKLPRSPLISETSKGKLVGNSQTVFQGGKPLKNLSTLLAVKSFENGNSFGFTAPGKSRLVKLPQYFLDADSKRNELLKSEVPAPLKISKFTTPTLKSNFVYEYPSWWDASPAASGDLMTTLNDGSSVVYRWYKFVDQPALQRFDLNELEKENLQKAVIKIQKDWARSPMMAKPSKGSLVSFDSGLFTTPPKNLEYGYVPIVIKQFLSSK